MRLLEAAMPEAGAGFSSIEPVLARPTGWTVVIPFYNEYDFIADTLGCVARQTVAARVILVDNGSTDGSAALAVATCKLLHVPYELVSEPRKGKVAALEAGLVRVNTRFVATWDADTHYPDHYLAHAQSLLERSGTAIAGAYYAAPDASRWRRLRTAMHKQLMSRVLLRQCHTGGAGQAFCTSALRAAGGFSAQQWNLVLEDHEIIHRVMRHGKMRYAHGLWCSPSSRVRDRAPAKWTVLEQLCYHAAMPVAGDWFFYRFLRPRLAARKLSSESLRERPAMAEIGREMGEICLA
jgi:glycosyltransferase involved in cell wall biosynthesis